MFVEHLPDGRVKYGMYYEYYLTGKRRRVTLTYNKDTKANRRIAEDTLRERIRAINSQDNTVDGLTLKALTDAYLRAQKTTVKASTYDRNWRFCNSTLRILGPDTLISQITADYVRNKFTETGASPTSLNERRARFRALWRWAYQQGYVDSTIVVDRIRPWKDVPHRAKIQDKFLEKNELKILLGDMEKPLWRDLTEFMALSGLRIGEAVALEASDIDLRNRYIHVTKTYDEKHRITTDPKTFDSTRDVFIQKELLPLCTLLKQRSGGGLIFQDKNGGYINYYSFNKYLRENSMAALDRPLTTHALRHTHVALCAEAGMDLDAIARRLGHSDSKITREVYFHVTQNMRERENEAMDKVQILS